jgi:hypothetical protein
MALIYSTNQLKGGIAMLMRYEITFDLKTMGTKVVGVEMEGSEHTRNEIILEGLKKLEAYPRSYSVLEIKGLKEMEEVLHTMLTSPRTKVEAKDYVFNAPHHYVIKAVENDKTLGEVKFQRGPILENGVNGITNEDLIAIAIDRLEHFQRSEFNCRENSIAITKLQEAQLWLQHRTQKRVIRGVEGTHKV